MTKIYYVVEDSSGYALSREVETEEEARAERKRIKKEDKKLGLDVDYIGYYITKYTDTGDTVYLEGIK